MEVYFIQGVSGGPIKIGYTTNLRNRLADLQANSPVQLQVLATVSGTIKDEVYYHRTFSAYRQHNEWFSPAPELLNTIERLNMNLLTDDYASTDPTSILNGPSVSEELITPEIAKFLLSTSPGNRNTSRANLVALMQDMQSGNFHTGADMLILDKNNRLRNGHHRCHAILFTGISVPLIVRRNVSEQEVAFFDKGKKRSINDDQLMMGVDPNATLINNSTASVVRSAWTNGYGKQNCFSNDTVRKGILHYEEFFNFFDDIATTFKKRPKFLTINVVKAVFLKAYYHLPQQRAKLKYAIEFLIDGGDSIQMGVTERLKGTDSLRSLRDYLTKANKGGSYSYLQEIYQKTERMLFAFLQGQEFQSVHRSTKELFPLPLPSFVPSSDMVEDIEVKTVLKKWLTQVAPNTYSLAQITADIMSYDGAINYKSLSSKISKYMKKVSSFSYNGRLLQPKNDGKQKKVKFYIVTLQ